MVKTQTIRNMGFPDHDSNWTDVVDLISENNWSEVNTISPVEFCNKLGHSVPYEWELLEKIVRF